MEIFRQAHGMFIWHVALRPTLRDDKYTCHRLPKKPFFLPPKTTASPRKFLSIFFANFFPGGTERVKLFKGPLFYRVTEIGVYTSSRSFLDSNFIDRK